jgi:hypothetical protein
MNIRLVKPMLEQLEDRLQPSVLVGSNVVPTLVNQVNTVLTDMQHAQTKLTTDTNNAANEVALTMTGPNGDDVRVFAHDFGKAVADYQRILSDQATIHSMVSTDTAVLQGVAMAEFQAGDPIDLVILSFFKGTSFDPTTQLTHIQTQADKIATDKTVRDEVHFTTFDLRNPATDLNFNDIRDEITTEMEVGTPSFGH